MAKYNWNKKEDGITGVTIYSLEDYGLYENDLIVRIFKDRTRNNITRDMEYRYFPQIDHETKEEQIFVQSENGIKYLKDAKKELIEAFEQYDSRGLESFVTA